MQIRDTKESEEKVWTGNLQYNWRQESTSIYLPQGPARRRHKLAYRIYSSSHASLIY